MKKRKIKGYSSKRWRMKIKEWIYNMFDDTELFEEDK